MSFFFFIPHSVCLSGDWLGSPVHDEYTTHKIESYCEQNHPQTRTQLSLSHSHPHSTTPSLLYSLLKVNFHLLSITCHFLVVHGSNVQECDHNSTKKKNTPVPILHHQKLIWRISLAVYLDRCIPFHRGSLNISFRCHGRQKTAI